MLEIFRRLFSCYGPQHWWPAEEPFEVIVGAILGQATSWANVEKSIKKLKAAQALNPGFILSCSNDELASLIHPCVYYNAKAMKLKAFVNWFSERFGKDLEAMFSVETDRLRSELLSVYGVGDETADAILLYAGNKPIFVISNYARRIFDRLGLATGFRRYSDYQFLFMENLPHDPQLFNEYHALLVNLGKNVCNKGKHDCGNCPIKDMCEWCICNNVKIEAHDNARKARISRIYSGY